MDDRRELYKTNGLSNATLCAEKRENFLKNRKEKRSAVYDRRRTVVILPDVKPQKNRKVLKNIANKRRKSAKQKTAPKVPPFVVGIVRHRIHSPPFLHGSAGIKNSKKKFQKVPIQSFAPKNYKFHPPKGLKVNILTPSKQENSSPFTLKSLFKNDSQKSDKKQEPYFEYVTVRTRGRKLSNNSPAVKITTPKLKVYEDDINKCKDVKKPLWSEDSEEPPIFGRFNLHKIAISKSTRSPFKDKNVNMATSFKKDNMILSPPVASQSMYQEEALLKGNCKIDSKNLLNDPSTSWKCRSYEESTNNNDVHVQYMSPFVQQLKSERCLDSEEVDSDNSTPTLCQTIISVNTPHITEEREKNDHLIETGKINLPSISPNKKVSPTLSEISNNLLEFVNTEKCNNLNQSKNEKLFEEVKNNDIACNSREFKQVSSKEKGFKQITKDDDIRATKIAVSILLEIVDNALSKMNISKDMNFEELKNKLKNEETTLYESFCSLPKSVFRKYKSISDVKKSVTNVEVEENLVLPEVDHNQSTTDQATNLNKVTPELNTNNQKEDSTELIAPLECINISLSNNSKIQDEVEGLNTQETNQLKVEESIAKINSNNEEKHISITLEISDDLLNNTEIKKAVKDINISENIENNLIDQSLKLPVKSNDEINKSMNSEERIITEINSNDELLENADTSSDETQPQKQVQDLNTCKDIQETGVNISTNKSLILTPIVNKSIVGIVDPLLSTSYKSIDSVSSNENEVTGPELEIKENRNITIKTENIMETEKSICKNTGTNATFTKAPEIIDLLDSPEINNTAKMIKDLVSKEAIEPLSQCISSSGSPIISHNIQIVVSSPSPTRNPTRKTLTYEDVLEDTVHTRTSNQTQVVSLVNSPNVQRDRKSRNVIKSRKSEVIIDDSNSPIALSTSDCKNDIVHHNHSVQDKTENDIIDLVSDDEEDYTRFIRRVLAKHGMSQNFSPTLVDSPRSCEKVAMVSMESTAKINVSLCETPKSCSLGKNSSPNNIPKIHVSLCETPKSCSSLGKNPSPNNIPKIHVSPCKTSESRVPAKNNCSAEKIPELHVTPCKTPRSRRILKENTPTETDTASPMRVLCLRNKKVDITPSPKKRTPRKTRATPCKTPKSVVPNKDDVVEESVPKTRGRPCKTPKAVVSKKDVVEESVPVHLSPLKTPRSRKVLIENTPAEADTASPVRVLCLRSRKVDVTPSPKKNTPKGRKKGVSPRI